MSVILELEQTFADKLRRECLDTRPWNRDQIYSFIFNKYAHYNVEHINIEFHSHKFEVHSIRFKTYEDMIHFKLMEL